MIRYLAFTVGVVLTGFLFYCASRYVSLEEDCARVGGIVVKGIHTKHCWIVGQR